MRRLLLAIAAVFALTACNPFAGQDWYYDYVGPFGGSISPCIGSPPGGCPLVVRP